MSPDNSYKKGLFFPFLHPQTSITPLLVGEVTNVLPNTAASKGRLGPVNCNKFTIYQYLNNVWKEFSFFLLTMFPFVGW